MQTTVAEEKAHNTRLGGNASERDFVGFMNNLKLPAPKLMKQAIPANLNSGKLEDDSDSSEVNWGPVRSAFSGMPEIDVEWVRDHLQEVHVIDVREIDELGAEGGLLPDAQVIPLGQLPAEIHNIPLDKPIVCLCRSGRRSAMAVTILKAAGIERVANIGGGMLRWQELNQQ
jgi:rhodanese-related sulfurtransferase